MGRVQTDSYSNQYNDWGKYRDSIGTDRWRLWCATKATGNKSRWLSRRTLTFQSGRFY